MTISKALTLVPKVRERLNELKGLRSEVSAKETRIYGEKDRSITEPQFDVVKVDKKIVKLELFLLDLDDAIKESNAKTQINVEFDKLDLFESLS